MSKTYTLLLSLAVACELGLGVASPVARAQCIANQFAKLLATDAAAGDELGRSVAIGGDVAIVGVPEDDDNGTDFGSAIVFRFDGTTWNQEAKLLAADGSVEDYFGWFVALSGNAAIVAAPLDDDNGLASGSAYIFRFDGTAWNQEAKLLAADGTAQDEFGLSIAISGDVVVVGAYGDDDNGSFSGSAYIFRFDGTAWNQEAKLLAADGVEFDAFGISVGISGDLAIVGAHLDDDNGTASGSAYLFRFDGTTWNQEAKLLATDGAANDIFGGFVAISGDMAVVGARLDDDNGSASDSAYLFRFDGTAWNQEAKLLAADGAVNDQFGTAVAISGDGAVVGAHFDDDNGTDSGSAYLFRFDGMAWNQQAKLLAADGAANDRFGSAVAVSGNGAVVGAQFDDDNGSASGSAYIFADLTDCNTNGLLDACEPGLALDIPRFVEVLLGSNADPVDACLADANRDSQTNALDIQPFVDTLLGS